MNVIARILPVIVQPTPSEQARPGRRSRIDQDELRRRFEAGETDAALAAHFDVSQQSIIKYRKIIGLLRRRGPGKGKPRTYHSRHEPKAVEGKAATMPPVDHPALDEARTLYPAMVVDPSGLLNLLIKGENSWKIGGEVTKGRWSGFPIYTLTLEERATCPTSCTHWRSCYGNHMNWAKRIKHGPEFEERLGYEIGVLAFRHPGGFAVRLHVLGDFYSVGYVDLWRRLLDRFPALHAFGFTARIDGTRDPIASALIDLVAVRWDRFAIRFSNAPIDALSTVSIEHPVQRPDDAIICPQQQGRTASCGTCGLCWATTKRIAFLRH